MDLFVPEEVRSVDEPLEVKLERTVATLAGLMREGVPISGAFSSGKDSTALMVCFFMAAERVIAEGVKPRLLVLHSDTGVENSLIAELAIREMDRMTVYARKMGIDLQVEVARPALLDSWAVRVIGGRSLPSVPERSGDCAIDWKIKPMMRLRNRILPGWGRGAEVVTLTGSRFEESAARSAKMHKRGDSDLVPVRNKMGELVMAPIANWTTDDVWTLLGLVANGIYTSYTDAKDVIAAYADAGPTSCAVVNDSITEGAPKKGGCGARFGCQLCMQVASDKSMDALLEKPEYGFMKGVARLRQWLVDTDYDLSERLWVGRTIKLNHIAIRPDVYSPKKMRAIFRMACTLDAIEREAAREAGRARPRFELVSWEQVIAIDTLWSLAGHWDCFAALDDWIDIHQNGARYEIPTVAEPFPKCDMPEPLFLPVGESWEAAANDHWAGLLDPYRAALLEDCLKVKTYGAKNPIAAWEGVVADAEFTVDAEGTAMFLDLEAEERIAESRHKQGGAGWAQTYRTYVQYGLLQISPHQVASHDEALKRNHWKRMNGLNGPEPDIEGIRQRALTMREVPREVLEAFLGDEALRKFDRQEEIKANEARQSSLF